MRNALLTTVNSGAMIRRMSRPRHPDKDIERAVRYAESLNWRVLMSHGHLWGQLFCPQSTRDGCKVGVYSTPRNPQNHARHIQRDVDLCPHMQANAQSNQGENEENGNQDIV